MRKSNKGMEPSGWTMTGAGGRSTKINYSTKNHVAYMANTHSR